MPGEVRRCVGVPGGKQTALSIFSVSCPRDLEDLTSRLSVRCSCWRVTVVQVPGWSRVVLIHR